MAKRILAIAALLVTAILLMAQVTNPTGGGGGPFPQTVSGTTTQYHFPYFSTSTTLSTDALLSDNGTVFDYTGTGGIEAGTGPTPAGSPTGGGVGCTEGTGPTAAASTEYLYCNSTLHDLAVNANGGVNKLVASSIGYNSGSISASVGSTNIASAANFPTGQYVLDCDVVVTAVGTSPTLAVTVGWTDISGTARTRLCVTGTVAISDNPTTQTISSNGSAAITITQTLAVSTATWQTLAALTRRQ
jgi:hypothetical protein